MLSMFIIASQDNWECSMFAGIDATGQDTGPYINYDRVISLYFLSYMIIGSFFVIQLFVGVFIDTFQIVVSERKALARQSSISSENTDTSNSMTALQEPMDWRRLVVYEIVTQRQFDLMIAFYIITNIVFMGSETFKMSSKQANVIDSADYIFNYVFGMEIIVKLYGLRAKYYFSSRWNQFDFSVSMISFAGNAAELLSSVISLNATSVRLFRMFRLFRS